MSEDDIFENQNKEPVIKGDGIEIRQGPYHWINFLRHHLADIYVRSEADYSPYRFWNRISFVNLKHIIIILFHEKKKKKKDDEPPEFFDITVEELISAFDPVYKQALFKELRKFGTFSAGGRKYKLEDQRIKNCLINLFETNIHILLFELTIDRKKQGDKIIASAIPNLVFKPLHDKLDRWKFYKYLFEPFDGIGPRTKLHFDIGGHYRDMSNVVVHKALEDNPTKFQHFEEDIIASCLDEVGEMIDEEYLHLCQSPMMRSFVQSRVRNKTGPSNVFFVGKIFNRQKTRFQDSYKYDPYFFMGRQSEDVKRQLLKMGGHKILADDLPEGECTTLKRQEFIPYPDAYYDDIFWLAIKDRDIIDNIIERINDPWPDHIRLALENNLLAGAKTILRNVFDEGGLGWIDTNGLTQDEIDAAHMRLAELHYILQLCSPKKPRDPKKPANNAKDLTIVADSIRVNGAVWMSVCYLRENIGDDPVEGLLDQKSFDHSHLISHSLLNKTVQRIRSKAPSHFIRSVSKIIKSIAYNEKIKKAPNVIPMTDKRGIHLLDNRVLKEINRHLKTACRVYPYDHINLESTKNDGQKASNSIMFKFVESPFYDRLSPKSYMNYKEIVEELFDQLQLRALERNDSDESLDSDNK